MTDKTGVESKEGGWEQKWRRKWGYRKRKWAYLSSEVFPVGMTHTMHKCSIQCRISHTKKTPYNIRNHLGIWIVTFNRKMSRKLDKRYGFGNNSSFLNSWSVANCANSSRFRRRQRREEKRQGRQKWRSDYMTQWCNNCENITYAHTYTHTHTLMHSWCRVTAEVPVCLSKASLRDRDVNVTRTESV